MNSSTLKHFANLFLIAALFTALPFLSNLTTSKLVDEKAQLLFVLFTFGTGLLVFACGRSSRLGQRAPAFEFGCYMLSFYMFSISGWTNVHLKTWMLSILPILLFWGISLVLFIEHYLQLNCPSHAPRADE